MSINHKIAAHSRWAAVKDPVAATAPARAGLVARFERLAYEAAVEAGVPPTDAEVVRRIEHVKKLHYLKMAAASAAARRAKHHQ